MQPGSGLITSTGLPSSYLQPIVTTTGHITFLQPTAMATGILHDILRSKCVHDVTEDVGTKQFLRQQSTGTCSAVEGLNRAWRQHRWRSRSSSSWCHPWNTTKKNDKTTSQWDGYFSSTCKNVKIYRQAKILASSLPKILHYTDESVQVETIRLFTI